MLRVCRALLTAVAVSCTLSRTRAHGPSTQRSDRIKDLMCVLLLSGMQKEDLDVKMLNKLERHNVNIHDMNNEELLQECITKHSDNYKTITTEQAVNQESKSKFKENNTKENGEIMDSVSIVNMNTEVYKNNTKSELENNKNKDVIQYIDGQPQLQSVLKFWQDIKTSKGITESQKKTSIPNRLPEETFKYDQKNKRNVLDASNSNEANTIQMLLANFLLKSENRNIIQTTDRISMNEIYTEILGSLNRRPIEFYQNNKIEVRPKSIPLSVIQTESRQNEYITPKDEKSSDILNAINTLKTYYTLKNEKSKDNFRRNNKQPVTPAENLHSKRFLKPTTTPTQIPTGLIQEIAKSVKELVLQDLRREMLQMTTSSYFRTTKNTIVSTTQESKADDRISSNRGRDLILDQSILNKFMDLFDEIKLLKHKTVIISSEIRKENNKVTKEESRIQTNPVMPLAANEMGPPITSYGINQYANFKIQKTFNFSPQIHKFRSKGVLKSKKQVSIKSTKPITFQTNNMEIPPLGIAIDKPEDPINQNIIVPTLTPYRIGDYKFNFNSVPLPKSRIRTDEYIQKLPNIPLLKTDQQNIHHSNEQSVERLPLHNNEFPNYNRIKYKQTNNRDEAKIPTIPRFHERLERNTDYIDIPEQYSERVDCCNEKYRFSKQMVECCNHKVASRQQMSLNMKKQSYDDTHFKNFLKSQQKVTDMLERVLASRSRVRSVETA